MNALELLEKIVAADDSMKAAWKSGQHSSINRWIPTEEAIQEARDFLNTLQRVVQES